MKSGVGLRIETSFLKSQTDILLAHMTHISDYKIRFNTSLQHAKMATGLNDSSKRPQRGQGSQKHHVGLLRKEVGAIFTKTR